MTIFKPFDVLLPKNIQPTWPVIAVDQFTSEPDYWVEVKKAIGGNVSAFNLVFPEAFLNSVDKESFIAQINATMHQYLDADVFRMDSDAFVYVERTLVNGAIRRGLVGVIDLETYDYEAQSTAQVRATERTVPERIPPRVAIRKDAPIELSHVLMLADDAKNLILSKAKEMTAQARKLYDFDLLGRGGHICGWLINGSARAEVMKAIAAYEDEKKNLAQAAGLSPMIYAVGDGNHSLATAKTIYDSIKKSADQKEELTHRARYAMVELENIYDQSQQFEPIHRLLTGIDKNEFFKAISEIEAPDGQCIHWYASKDKGSLYIKTPEGVLPLQVIQVFLDDYVKTHDCAIDYIHGEDSLAKLSCDEHAVGLVMPAIAKDGFFEAIVQGGVLPRKTFSMGHSVEKRFYMEARRIRED